MLLAALVTIVIAAGAFAGWQILGDRSEAPIIAVAPADPSATSQTIARDLLVKLGHLESARPNSIELLADGRQSKQPDLIFEAGSAIAGSRTEAQLVLLDGRNRSILWSRNFESPTDRLADLKQQLAITAARVMACALESGEAKLNQQVLKSYLNGCAAFAEVRGLDPRSVISTFREVVRQSPDFVGAWAKLIMAEAQTLGALPPSEHARLSRTLREDIAAARKLDPKLPAAYLADFLLLPRDAVEQRTALMSKALLEHPDDPSLLELNSSVLFGLGFASDAVDHAKRAAGLDPLSPSTRSNYITVLGWAGRIDTAAQELKAAERLWPGTGTVLDASFRFHLRHGDPREALRILRTGVYPMDPRITESFLLARIQPTGARIEAAIASVSALTDREPTAIGHLLQALAEFGREEQMYKLLLDHGRWDKGYVNEVIFRPAFHRFRHDRRFLLVTERSGLLDYWRNTAKWPDFCFDPGLPYDCKKEAAKLAA